MKRKSAQNSGAQRKRAAPRGRPFPKGTSGNPGGRPKEEREVVEALRLHGDELVTALLKQARKGNVKAIAEAFNRAYGKAKQVVELTGAGGGPLQVDLSKLTTEQVRQLRELVAAATPKP